MERVSARAEESGALARGNVLISLHLFASRRDAPTESRNQADPSGCLVFLRFKEDMQKVSIFVVLARSRLHRSHALALLVPGLNQDCNVLGMTQARPTQDP